MIRFDDTFEAFNTVLTFSLCLEGGEGTGGARSVERAKEAEGDEGAASNREGVPAQVSDAFHELRALCERYENLFSRTIPASDISRINSAGGEAVAVAPETAQMVARALTYCEKSGGVFDVTAGCLTRLWDFHQGIVPEQQTLQQAVQRVDWRTVNVFQENDTWYVQLADPAAALDVGGIAKGWIADELGKYLQRKGFEDFLINLGGNVLAHGHNAQGKPWTIGITNPFPDQSEDVVVRCTGESVVTSGTYERCFQKNGVLMHHILDPQTGFPVVTDAVGATIVCEKSIDAEGFSTTALALGVESGLAFCKAQPEIISAIFIDVRGNVHTYEAEALKANSRVEGVGICPRRTKQGSSRINN